MRTIRIQILKAACTAALASAAAYFGTLAAPLCILLTVMLVDYVTGLAKAYVTAQLCSKIGIRGILKKLCYMAMVVVGAVIDYLLENALIAAGIDLQPKLFCGLLVSIWLIINELISILENLSMIGVPGFPALEKLLGRLRSAVASTAEITKNGE